MHDYIKLVSLSKNGDLSLDKIIEEGAQWSGEVVFGLVITLGPLGRSGEGSCPKKGSCPKIFYKTPVGMLIKAESPWYSLLTCKTSGWQGDSWLARDEFTPVLIQHLGAYLDLDPMADPPPTTTIGFSIHEEG